MKLHKYVGFRGGGLIHEKETEWCCTKIKKAVSDKQLRISFGGIHINAEYCGKLYFLDCCPFCGVPIIIKRYRISNKNMEIISKSAIEYQMGKKR